MREDRLHQRMNGGSLQNWEDGQIEESEDKRRRPVTFSELEAIAQLKMDGYTVPEVSEILGIPVGRIRNALKSDRYGTVERLLGTGARDIVNRARMQYRTEKAREVIDRSLDSDNQWLAYSAAVQVLQADERRRKDEKESRFEVVLTSEFLTCSDDPGGTDDPGEEEEQAVYQECQE